MRSSEPESTPAFAALVSPRGDYEVRLGEGAWILSLHAPGSTEATDELTVTLSDDGRSTVNFTVRKHGSTIESK